MGSRTLTQPPTSTAPKHSLRDAGQKRNPIAGWFIGHDNEFIPTNSEI